MDICFFLGLISFFVFIDFDDFWIKVDFIYFFRTIDSEIELILVSF